jgi:hypothetical protein
LETVPDGCSRLNARTNERTLRGSAAANLAHFPHPAIVPPSAVDLRLTSRRPAAHQGRTSLSGAIFARAAAPTGTSAATAGTVIRPNGEGSHATTCTGAGWRFSRNGTVL